MATKLRSRPLFREINPPGAKRPIIVRLEAAGIGVREKRRHSASERFIPWSLVGVLQVPLGFVEAYNAPVPPDGKAG